MMIGRRAEVLPIECVVRGYLSGSAWKAYLDDGAICGIRLPSGLRESDRLPGPIFTPRRRRRSASTTRTSRSRAWRRSSGPSSRPGSATRRSRCTAHGAAVCERAGIILADTKFEFGVLPSGELLLIDEVLTPDSSPLLGRRRPTSPAAAQAELRQAVRPRLARTRALGQDAARPRAAGRRRRRHARPLRRGLRADHRRQLRPLSHGGRHRPMSDPVSAYRFAVNVTPKPGILDPQGRAVERSLPHLGIDGVARRARRAAGRADGRRRPTRPRRGRWSSGWPASCCRTR